MRKLLRGELCTKSAHERRYSSNGPHYVRNHPLFATMRVTDYCDYAKREAETSVDTRDLTLLIHNFLFERG